MCKMLLQAITVKEGKLSHARNTSLFFPERSGTGFSAPGVIVKQEHDPPAEAEGSGSSLPSKVSMCCWVFQLSGQGWGRASLNKPCAAPSWGQQALAQCQSRVCKSTFSL